MVGIKERKMRLVKLQKLDKEATKIKATRKLQKDQKNINGVLYYQKPLFISKII